MDTEEGWSKVLSARARDIALVCALAAVAAASWTSVLESHAASERGRFDERCRPARANGFLSPSTGSRLVVANRYARAYYERSASDLSYCRPGRSEPEITLFAEEGYPPPAISLVGPYLGYAGVTTEPGVADSVVVVDVRRNDDVVFIGDSNGGVGSLKVNRQGSVAWIACPFGQLTVGKLDCTTATGSRVDRSQRSVYLHDAASSSKEPVLLARSRRIEVGSLRRKGSRVYWTQGGKTRHASFP